MKTIKRISLAMLMLGGVVTFSACEKSEDSIAPYGNEKAGGHAWSIFNGVDDCAGSGGNCLTTVVVVPEKAQLIGELRKAIADGRVQDFVRSNKFNELFPRVKGRGKSDLVTGRTTLIEKGNGNFIAVYSDTMDPLNAPSY